MLAISYLAMVSTRAQVCSMTEGWANMLKNHIQIAPEPPMPVRVLCMVRSHVKNIEKQNAVWNTWGKHCDGFHVWTDKLAGNVPSRILNVPGGHDELILKTRAMLKEVWETEWNNAYDYFFCADDDTYTIIPNLKHSIFKQEQLHPNEPLYLGRRFVASGSGSMFNTGASGYVLNRKSLQLFITYMDQYQGSRHGSWDDVYVADVLALANVLPADSEANDGHTFIPISPESSYVYRIGSWGNNSWFDAYQVPLYGGEEQYNRKYPCCGVHCCSRYTASFHYVSAQNMFVIHNLIYACKKVVDQVSVGDQVQLPPLVLSLPLMYLLYMIAHKSCRRQHSSLMCLKS